MKGKYSFYTTNEIKPLGWLKDQLKIQAEGLSGNLDKMWPDIRDSAWIGGNCEGWERVPYWLDGFIPLAYLLDDEGMKARAKRYIDAIIEGQQSDGWICPCSEEARASYDTWAVQLISKVLTVYYECSKDQRIPDVLYRTMKNYYELLKDGKISLFAWGKYRWFEAFTAINKLYEIYGEEWILDLARIMSEQGADYEDFTSEWIRPINRWRFETHIVNIGMMFKNEAVTSDILGQEYTGKADRLHDILKKYHGTPVALFTGDECLAGLSPIHGSELCAVVEQMYSYELLYAYTGDKKWAERLEVLAFNALPATISDDMWTHQYLQLSNQIACIEQLNNPIFGSNNGQSHLFGLEPNFGCCTANFNQGWPKFALSAFMKGKNGIINALPIPSSLDTKWNGVPISIELVTEYPFKNSFIYKIKADSPVKFKFSIRIPSFAKNVKVNGNVHLFRGDLHFDRVWTDDTIEISFDTVPKLEGRPHQLYTAKCGSLVFSLPIEYQPLMREYTRDGVERKFPYCDYELKPISEWEYGFASKELKVEYHEGDCYPFSSKAPRVTLEADLVPINWGIQERFETICAEIPNERKAKGAPRKIKLAPYGGAKLRMTEMPLIK